MHSVHTRPLVVAITGGPSGGKTTLLQILQKDFGTSLRLVPEAASILYRGGFPRTGTAVNRRHVQRAICFVQRELEDLACAESAARFGAESAAKFGAESAEKSPAESAAGDVPLVICDRGTLDSIAYWPSDEADFFASLKSDRPTELARYDWIIHLDTAPEGDFDRHNPIRTETFDEAMSLNAKIHAAWAGHPRRIIIPNNVDFLEKMGLARQALALIRLGKSRAAIEAKLFPGEDDRSG